MPTSSKPKYLISIFINKCKSVITITFAPVVSSLHESYRSFSVFGNKFHSNKIVTLLLDILIT